VTDRDPAELHAAALSRFAAVVVTDRWGGRLLWSSSQQAWVPSIHYGVGFLARDGFTPHPDEEQVRAVVAVASRVGDSGWYGCGHCGVHSLGAHFVAPDVFGDPRVYCVQRPSHTVVQSSGGSGRKKHAGEGHGCQSVERQRYTRNYGPGDDEDVYCYGVPMVARDVIDLEWCSRCTSIAVNMRAHAQPPAAQT